MPPTLDLREARLPNRRREAGVALIAAVFALALIGALVAGSFFAGLLEQQSGRNSLFAAQAREAAEAGLVEAMAALDPAELEELPLGAGTLEQGVTSLGEHVTVRHRVARLTSRLFLIRAEGIRHDLAGGTLATRTLGLLIQLAPAESATPTESGASHQPMRLAERAWIRLD